VATGQLPPDSSPHGVTSAAGIAKAPRVQSTVQAWRLLVPSVEQELGEGVLEAEVLVESAVLVVSIVLVSVVLVVSAEVVESAELVCSVALDDVVEVLGVEIELAVEVISQKNLVV
jgi:hypothetical protein